TKKSLHPFVSPATRFEAVLSNATICPSAESAGSKLSRFPSAPDESTLTRVVDCPLANDLMPAIPTSASTGMDTRRQRIELLPGRFGDSSTATAVMRQWA